MDLFIRTLERKAKAEGDWKPLAYALLRLLGDQQPDDTAIYVAIKVRNDEPTATLFTSLKEAYKHHFEDFLKELDSIQLSAQERIDLEKAIRLSESGKYIEAWEAVDEGNLASRVVSDYYVTEHQMGLEKT